MPIPTGATQEPLGPLMLFMTSPNEFTFVFQFYFSGFWILSFFISVNFEVLRLRNEQAAPRTGRLVSNKPGRHRLTRAKPEHTSKGASPIDAVYGATTHISGDSFPRSKPKAWSSKSSSSSSASPTDGTRRGNIWSFAYQTCILLVLQRRLTPCN